MQSDRPGYWWGKDPVEEEQEEAPKTETPPPAKKPEEKPKEDPKKYAWENREELRLSEFSKKDIWDMKPKEFEALMEAFRDQAVRRPTEEHVRDTYGMVDLARRKSAAFANVQQYVVHKYPEISTERDYPVAATGKAAVQEQLQQEVTTQVQADASDFGLIYFYRHGCPYCKAEEGVLQDFIASRHFSVEPVDIEANPAVAARFNITITPSLILIKRGNMTPMPISYGVISEAELEARVYNGVRQLNGEATPEQYGMRNFERGGAFDPTAPIR